MRTVGSFTFYGKDVGRVGAAGGRRHRGTGVPRPLL